MIGENAPEESTLFCIWCGRSVTPTEVSVTSCGLICHSPTSLEGKRRNCVHEHARDCENCLIKSLLLPGVGIVTTLFWECRCEEQYIHPFHLDDCPACCTARDSGMPAKVQDVLSMAHEWHLDASLVARLREVFPDPWDPSLQVGSLLDGAVKQNAGSEGWMLGMMDDFSESYL
jgi:hypothetical protein